MVICSTGPLIHSSFHDASITDIVSTIILEIDHGVYILDDQGSPIRVKAGAIALEVYGSDILLSDDLKALRAVGSSHTIMISRHGSAPPTCIEMQPFATNHEQVLDVLTQAGAVQSRIVLCRNVLSLTRVEYFDQLLQTYSNMLLCIDSFGTVETPPVGPMFPNDAEIIQALQILLDRGWVDRIIVSVHVRYKMDLCAYGGSGYAHLERSVIPRMRHMNISEDQILAITSINASRLIAWYSPPPPKAVELEMMPCFICGTRFVLGEHYEKFSFVYCSSKCLQAHRKLNWAKCLNLG